MQVILYRPRSIFTQAYNLTGNMTTGLVLGKFLPLHTGHIALVNFALQHCDQLIVLLCYNEHEPIPGRVREKWLQSTFEKDPRVKIVPALYDEAELPGTSVSSIEASRLWSNYIRQALSPIDIFFSSEPYGDHVAEFLDIRHLCFDQPRTQVPVSASSILRDPFGQWKFIAKAAQPYFVKKICISGSESTGKSVLAERLAKHFNTVFVPEMARDIIGKTEEVEFEDLGKIAEHHARAINEQTKHANKILICDTDINITKSYSKFLFNRILATPLWVNEANEFSMRLFLETDCPFIQDGTRLPETERNRLGIHHKAEMNAAGIHYQIITGNWEERFEKAKQLITNLIATAYTGPWPQ